MAIKVGGINKYLIEVKAIGTDLKDNHLKQAVDYGANQGIEWICLTNGYIWQVHRIKFEKPISNELVFEVNLLDPDRKIGDLAEPLFLISKEASASSHIDAFYERKEATSKFIIAQILMQEPALKVLKREVKRISDGIRIEDSELIDILRSDIIKRDCISGEPSDHALAIIKKSNRKQIRQSKPKVSEESDSVTAGTPVIAAGNGGMRVTEV